MIFTFVDTNAHSTFFQNQQTRTRTSKESPENKLMRVEPRLMPLQHNTALLT